MLRETTRSRPDAAETLSAYCAWLARTGRSPGTKDKYASLVGFYLTWLGGRADTYAGALVEPDVRDYAVRDWRRELIEARQAPPTIALKMAAVADLYRWMGMERPDVPTSQPEESEAKALDEDEIRAVLRAAHRRGPRDAAVVSVLFYTACRVGELCKINLDDFWISPRGGEARLIGKGDRQRTVDLNAPCRAALDAWLRERDRRLDRAPGAPLFLTREGRRLTRAAAEHAVKQTGKAAGLVKEGASESWLHPHVLRHTWATRYLQGGGDVRTAQTVLGHADLRTTAKYTTPSRQRRREAMDAVVIDL
jgi:site-specific recombinase XerD